MLTFLLACNPEPVTPTQNVGPTPVIVPLEEAVTVRALLDHLGALEDLADANGAMRAHLSQGYLDSADYIEEQLVAAGYNVERDVFSTVQWDVDDAVFETAAAEPFIEWDVMGYSPSGVVEATIVPVDLVLPPGPVNSSTSGCEEGDFAGFPAGAIALLQRGTCTFSTKVRLAEEAGAAAVLVFNEGQVDRTGVLGASLDPGDLPSVPALGLSFALGEALAVGGIAARVEVDSELFEVDDVNLIAELPGNGEEGVVMLGAHLDSVPEGPGINDNGSGSAFVLEVALQAAETGWQPAHPVRFAWWGAEEIGLVGSQEWVYEDGEPDSARLDSLAAYLNFDMMASSNGARFVYDGDNSDVQDGGGSAGSGAIEAVYLDWFADAGLTAVPEGMFVPTDSWWFVLEGVPTGGVFSGAFEAKPSSFVAEQGGMAGLAYDVCYHRACDRFDQVDPVLYDDLVRSSAHVVQTLADREGPVSQARKGPRQRLPMPDAGRPFGCHGHGPADR